MADRLHEGISGDDAAIFSINTTDNGDDNETEDPTGKMYPMQSSLRWGYGIRRTKIGGSPSGNVLNLTPGAKRVQW